MIKTFKFFSPKSNSLALVPLNRIHSTSKLSNDKSVGLLDRVFGTRVEKATQAHSVLLADQQILYELQIHSVKPDSINEYENLLAENVPNLLKSHSNLKLTGSWRSDIGDLDQYVHLWRYKNYSEYTEESNKLKSDANYKTFNNKLAKLINHRQNQVCLSFTFWGDPEPRDNSHIYEMRSYSLKPGTLIEWGNNWQRGIRNRLDYRVAGMFTQVGPLYYVHHIWAYKNLADRKASREKMWDKPGWDECVAYTVPLINRMESKMMSALPFSPNK